ncbi:Origin recognition complex, subunit 1 [Rhizophlyctis rosea]|uniref:Origin recognition complex subunit 1 n=1 Tax=Rhizophlyctis rosea TaxID=64517 RepID=A0AAD5X227_9FUNG|nr:Origin recognition complex, subunit 1 [Rhizophlyctis rosea]
MPPKKKVQDRAQKLLSSNHSPSSTSSARPSFSFLGNPISKSLPAISTPSKARQTYDPVTDILPPTPTHRLTRGLRTQGYSNATHYTGFHLNGVDYKKGDCVLCDTSDSDGDILTYGVLQDCWEDEQGIPMIKVRWLYGKDQVEEVFSRGVRGKKKAPEDLEEDELLYSNQSDNLLPKLIHGKFELLPHDQFRQTYPTGSPRQNSSSAKKRNKSTSKIAAAYFCRRGWDARGSVVDGFQWEDFLNLRDMVMVKEGSVRARLAAAKTTRAAPHTPTKSVSERRKATKVAKTRLKPIPEDGGDGVSDGGQSDDNSADETYQTKHSSSESESDAEPDDTYASTPSKKRKRSTSPSTPSKRIRTTPSHTTPTRKQPRTPSKSITTPRTPRSGRLRSLDATLPDRTIERQESLTEYERARERLHVSAVPDELPCREREFDKIYEKLVEVVEEGAGDCIYISGVPGTGKTATVQRVIRQLMADVEEEILSPFQYVEINGMKLTDPTQAYVQLWEALSGNRAAPLQAADLLNKRFSTPSPGRQPVVVLVDELDLLVNKNQKVIYNLFDWPFHPHSRLIVIAIANTMDLPERLLNTKIVHSRLEGVEAFESSAIEFCARKVGAVSGDARRALDICRRAVEILEKMQRNAPAVPETPGTKQRNKHLVTMGVIDQAVKEMYTSAGVQTVQRLGMMQRMFLFAVVRRIKKTGVGEVEFGDVVAEYGRLCKHCNVEEPNFSRVVGICMQLGGSRVLVAEVGKGGDLKQKIKMGSLTEADLVAATRNGVRDAVWKLAD